MTVLHYIGCALAGFLVALIIVYLINKYNDL